MGRGVSLALAGLILAGCGGTAARGPAAAYPPYTGHVVDLFDDGIDAIAVGYQLEPGPAPAADAKLRERVQTADAVVRARVVTVSSRQQETGRSWQLGLHTLGVLAGKSPPAADFQLEVEATDPGAGMVKAFESGLVNATFVVCVRTFGRAGELGEPDLHFHLSADKPDVLDAVKQATLLDQLR